MKFEKIAVQEGTSVEYMTPELLFLAQSGQPYRGTVYVHFISKGESFNLIDFKKYITSLRSITLVAENSAYEIFKQIQANIDTDTLGVIVDITARGGIQQHICFGETFTPTKKQNFFQMH